MRSHAMPWIADLEQLSLAFRDGFSWSEHASATSDDCPYPERERSLRAAWMDGLEVGARTR